MNNRLILRLRHLLSMPRAEVTSRQNAWSEVQEAGRDLLAALDSGDTDQTSHAMASLAGSIMGKSEVQLVVNPSEYNSLLRAAHQLAGSVLAQYPGDIAADGQTVLPLDEASTRALADAQRTGQADPLVKTVAIGPGSTGPNGVDDGA